MFLKVDITVKEITNHSNRECCSGHIAPEFFKREGPDGPEEPTRFFHVIGNGINGIYCEPCLIIANYLARQKKKEKGK
jgi:hypothetical protein